MKGLTRSILAGGGMCLLASSAAFAQYRPPAARSQDSSGKEEDFERSVDPKRFRKGNFEWDTQELIASGFSALHREHEQILKELAGLKAEMTRLKEEKK